MIWIVQSFGSLSHVIYRKTSPDQFACYRPSRRRHNSNSPLSFSIWNRDTKSEKAWRCILCVETTPQIWSIWNGIQDTYNRIYWIRIRFDAYQRGKVLLWYILVPLLKHPIDSHFVQPSCCFALCCRRLLCRCRSKKIEISHRTTICSFNGSQCCKGF